MTAPRWTDWPPLVVLTLAGLLLVGVGALLGAYYCEYRRVSEVQQLTQVTLDAMSIGKICIGTLGEVVPGAFVLARQDRPRLVVTRDSAREARWTSP